MKINVLERKAVSPSIGFCTVTDAGPVVSMYRDAGHGRRVFESMKRAEY